ncbi:hypothetical protein VNO78_15180 [Psophocarpus tetragonolobus]|uniref:Uncharacterized protein n=1 Tax=Psophocarpus tetragonolobus TaxID=3891 RepID=A0AAN9XJM4_PSOTE
MDYKHRDECKHVKEDKEKHGDKCITTGRRRFFNEGLHRHNSSVCLENRDPEVKIKKKTQHSTRVERA